MKYFELEESPYYTGHSIIKFTEKIKVANMTSSLNVLQARLLNLSWADYLRLCRDMYGAELVGKNSLYVVAYFPTKSEGGRQLCSELNKRMAAVLENKT